MTPIVSFIVLRKEVEALALFVSDDESRYALTGICFEVNPKRLTLIATNGSVMGVLRADAENIQCEKPLSFIWKPVLPMTTQAKRWEVATDGKIVRCKLLHDSAFTPDPVIDEACVDATYPNWKHIIEDNPPIQPSTLNLNARYTLLLSRAAVLLTQEPHAFTIFAHDDLSAVSVKIGDRFTGKVMPVKISK